MRNCLPRVEAVLVLTCLAVFLAGCNATRPAPPQAPLAHAAPSSSTSIQATPFTQDVPNSTAKFVMRPVPGGTESIEPGGGGEVRVAPLWFGETEVTWDAYDVFLLRLDVPPDQRATARGDPGPDAVTRPTPPYAPPDRGWGHANFPVIGVTFHAAQVYCQWLSHKTGRPYRLPTVAEWRHACRAGGTPDVPLEQRAWFASNSDEQTHRVAEKRANALGLYDMLGNAAEWCIDEKGNPVACGGSFQDEAADLTCLRVQKQTPDWNASDPSFPRSKWWLRDAPFVGFRVVCEGSRR